MLQPSLDKCKCHWSSLHLRHAPHYPHYASCGAPWTKLFAMWCDRNSTQRCVGWHKTLHRHISSGMGGRRVIVMILQVKNLLLFACDVYKGDASRRTVCDLWAWVLCCEMSGHNAFCKHLMIWPAYFSVGFRPKSEGLVSFSLQVIQFDSLWRKGKFRPISALKIKETNLSLSFFSFLLFVLRGTLIILSALFKIQVNFYSHQNYRFYNFLPSSKAWINLDWTNLS